METRVLLTITVGDDVFRFSTEDLSFGENSAEDYLYNGRIISIDDIKQSMADLFYGATITSSINAALDNTDNYFSMICNTVEFRGATARYDIADLTSDSIIRTFYFRVQALNIGINEAQLQMGEMDSDAWETTIPKYRITEDLFDTGSIPDESLGKPVCVWFGQSKNVSLYCIGENTDTDEYDYLIGHGDVASIDAVYRMGNGTKINVNNTIVASGTNTTSTALRLIDSNATFISSGVKRNMAVINMGSGQGAFVESVDSETQLTITADIFDASATGEAYKVGGEYVLYDGSQSAPYPGFAFIRFALEQRDANGTLYEMSADITMAGTTAESPVMALRGLIADDDWGLGLSAPTLSWLIQAKLLDGIEWKMAGGFYEFKKAKEWRDILLLQCRLARLSITSSGNYAISIPAYSDASATFNKHNMKVQSYNVRPIDEHVNNVVVHYKYDLSEGNYLLEKSYETGQAFGQTRDYYLPFLINNAGAEAITKLLGKRFFHQDRRLESITGHDGIALSVLDAVTINYPDLQIYDANHEVIEMNIGASESKMLVAACPRDMYQY